MDILKYSVHPRTVYLEILYGCNLYCNYCYIGRERNHTKPIVPALEKTTHILNILKRENVEEIVLLGGEPLLHPHLSTICRTIAELGFLHRGVVTNGTVMTQERAQLLQETGFWVDISFRGPNASTFDDIAGKAGSFRKAFDAALLLSRLGISVGVEFDCIPENYTRVYDTMSMLVEHGVHIKQLQLHRIMPEGDAKNSLDKCFLTLDQWQVVFHQAARIRNELRISVIFEDGFPFCLVQPEYWDMITPCACGFTLLRISPTGDVHYCACRESVLGNVLNDSLSVLWEESLRGYRTPSKHHPACLECDLLEVCRGGCSASSQVRKMDEDMDIFHEHFRSVKFDGSLKPETKFIIGQSICNYEDVVSEEQILTAGYLAVH